MEEISLKPGTRRPNRNLSQTLPSDDLRLALITEILSTAAKPDRSLSFGQIDWMTIGTVLLALVGVLESRSMQF